MQTGVEILPIQSLLPAICSKPSHGRARSNPLLLSTAEVDNVALEGAGQEVVWLQYLYQELIGKAEPVLMTLY